MNSFLVAFDGSFFSFANSGISFGSTLLGTFIGGFSRFSVFSFLGCTTVSNFILGSLGPFVGCLLFHSDVILLTTLSAMPFKLSYSFL